jgi:hypothetical protein
MDVQLLHLGRPLPKEKNLHTHHNTANKSLSQIDTTLGEEELKSTAQNVSLLIV